VVCAHNKEAKVGVVVVRVVRVLVTDARPEIVFNRMKTVTSFGPFLWCTAVDVNVVGLPSVALDGTENERTRYNRTTTPVAALLL